MKDLINNIITPVHIKNSISYENYLHSLGEILKENQISIEISDKKIIHDTKLNFHKMKSFYRNLMIDNDLKDTLLSLDKKMLWVVIFDGRFGDDTLVLPTLAKIAEQTDSIELKILLEEENPELKGSYALGHNRIVPRLVCLKPNGLTELGIWAPSGDTNLFTNNENVRHMQKEMIELLKSWSDKTEKKETEEK